MADDKSVETLPEAPPPVAGKETMSVNVKGDAAAVMNRLNGGQAKAPTAEVKKGENSDAVIEALKVAKNVFVVKRVEPETFKNVKTRREVHSGECPATLREIVDFVSKYHGGEKYRIAVNDGETGKTIAADRFTIEADPIIPVDPHDEELTRIIMGGNRRDPAQMTEDAIQKQTAVMLAQAELERAKDTLDQIRSGGKKAEAAPTTALEQRMARLEQLLVEDRHQKRIDALEAELRAARTQPAAPKTDSNELLIKFMEKSDEKFEKLMAKMQADKMDAVLAELKSIKEKPAQSGNDLITQVLALKKVGSVLGWRLGDEDDDDDEEPKEWWEILMKDHLPRLWDVLEGKKGEGKSMSKEEVIAEMNKATDAAIAEGIARNKQRQLPPPNVAPVLPAPKPVVAPAIPVPVVAPVAPTVSVPVPQVPPVTEKPSVPVPAVVEAPPAVPETPPAKPEPEMLSVEQEIVLRCAKVLMVLDQEMEIRPRDYSWNAIAWDALPEDHADALAAVNEPHEIPAVFSNNILKPEKVAEMTEKMKHPKVAKFVKHGLDEFKEWHAKAQADPNFDPFDEDEDGEEPETPEVP